MLLVPVAREAGAGADITWVHKFGTNCVTWLSIIQKDAERYFWGGGPVDPHLQHKPWGTHEQIEPCLPLTWASRSPVPLARYVGLFCSGVFGPEQYLTGFPLLATCHPLPASLTPTWTASGQPNRQAPTRPKLWGCFPVPSVCSGDCELHRCL